MDEAQADCPRSEVVRFWRKVDKRGTEVHPFCWIWTAGKNGKGYGRFWYEGATIPAHRLSYELLIERPPDELLLDHLCRNHACVNPVHLEPVTSKVNTLRGIGPTALNVLKTHCPRGHAFDAANTYLPARGGRECRACRALVSSQQYTKRLLEKLAQRTG